MPSKRAAVTVTDAYGDQLSVHGLVPADGVPGAVMITARHPGTAENIAVLLDTPQRRDDFARPWMEACRRADGEPPAGEASQHA
jgi:hypothetical protein